MNSLNRYIGIGRLVKDPETRWSQDGKTCISRYTLAIDRYRKNDGDQSADFPMCVAFGKAGEFAEKYLRKGMKIAVEGRLQTGFYTAKDGHKVYTTEIVVDQHYFCESKSDQSGSAGNKSESTGFSRNESDSDGFSAIPDIQEELPFI